ncbi:polyketide cyclase/dehydrase/lipid transport protein [Nocardia tenerifensis]|uniref:Polyketide cyclase/dehydrase/lipid transport protein n=1 Tax=Nocardia tenerifensis TaxID=228006 RepID=A0A318JSM7_9NOCA|nr:SRPBCC family protein [Nocardia tenerifensis]PXX52844.1 polyketide cyclase/dehydrase/lipid transport protein [Nocardia tenerifensis]
MAKLKVSVDVPISPEDAWSHTSNLADLDKWLTMHEAWRSEVPEQLTVGTELVGVASVKGLRNRVTWTVKAAEPPRRLKLTGAGKGGTKLGLELLVTPKGTGSEVTVDIDLGGKPLFGPIGAGVARAVKGDIERSLEKFVALYG